MGVFDTERVITKHPNLAGRMSKIYAIADGFGYVKIGFSFKVRARLIELQVSNPRKLKLLGAVEGSKKLEKMLHKHLSSCYVRGEWFKDCDELRRVVALIKNKDKYGLSQLLGLIQSDERPAPQEPKRRLYRRC